MSEHSKFIDQNPEMSEQERFYGRLNKIPNIILGCFVLWLISLLFGVLAYFVQSFFI